MAGLFKRRATLAALALATLAAPAAAQLTPIPQDTGATGLGLALRRLPVTGRVLYVTAHPDDEDNAALVALGRGRGLRTALLTLTRGEGGQNAIGPELFEALGVLRTEELAAVHRYDGAEQFFGRAYEFGFSVSGEETLARWGHEETLGDVVRVVRRFRPDVILTLPVEAPGHAHHTTAARLAAEAFRAAADPARFPGQIREGLRPWQARRIYQGGVGGDNDVPAGQAVVLRTGDYDPLLGTSWTEHGSLARTLHKCQAAGQLKVSPGEYAEARYRLLDSEPKVADAETDVLGGLDLSLPGLLRFAKGADTAPLAAALAAADAEAQRASAAYDARAPHRSLGPLLAGLAALRRAVASVRAAGLDEAARDELVPRLDAKQEDFLAAVALAQGLELEATADDGDVTRGQTFGVTLRVFNRGPEPVEIGAADLRVPAGWAANGAAVETRRLASNQGLALKYAVSVGADARDSRPYWTRRAGRDRYDVEVPGDESLAWSPPDVVATVGYTAGGTPARLDRPVVWRYEGRWVGAEKQKVVNVVPALSVRMMPEIVVFPITAVGASARRELRVAVQNNAKTPASASLRLEAPPGWAVEPREVPMSLRSEGQEATARFLVTPPRGAKDGEGTLRAVATSDGVAFSQGVQVVAYDHIQERHILRPSSSRALSLDVRVAPGVVVGYVMGVGDEVPEAIRQLGLPVTLLTPDDLAYADLSRYTTIVTGVRAYHARKDLRSYHDRIMKYVENGGNLVVQYNRGEFNPAPDAPSPFAPYPARVTTERVTDETAPVDVLVPSSPALTHPNRIGPPDWEGWLQERGIQLLDARDPRYTDLVSSQDPFPRNPGVKKGLLVVARVGQGTWTYVGLGLFRQLPAGTRGAYRLLANLLSRPRGR